MEYNYHFMNEFRVFRSTVSLLPIIQEYTVSALEGYYKDEWWEKGVLDCESHEPNKNILMGINDRESRKSELAIDVCCDIILKKPAAFKRPCDRFGNRLPTLSTHMVKWLGDDRDTLSHSGHGPTDDEAMQILTALQEVARILDPVTSEQIRKEYRELTGNNTVRVPINGAEDYQGVIQIIEYIQYLNGKMLASYDDKDAIVNKPAEIDYLDPEIPNSNFPMSWALPKKARDRINDFELLKEEAVRGDKDALYLMGYCFQKGLKVNQNKDKMLFWYKDAVKNGCRRSAFALGKYYGDPSNPEYSPSESVRYYMISAIWYCVKAQYLVGMAYLNGYGVRRNPQLARFWFRQAADVNFAPAMYQLGQMYLREDTIGKSYSNAIYWFGNASDSGYADSMTAMGKLWMKDGSSRGSRMASRWFERAKRLGSKEAADLLDELDNNAPVRMKILFR